MADPKKEVDTEKMQSMGCMTNVFIWLTFPFSGVMFLVVGSYECILNSCFRPCWEALERLFCANFKGEPLVPDDYCEIPAIAKEGQEVLPVPIFHLETANWKSLRRQYYRDCRPFVLRHKNGDPITLVEPTAREDNEAPPTGRYAYGDSKAAKESGMREIAGHFVRVLIYAGEHWLLGNYFSSLAHVDGGLGDRTFYLMRNGKKDITIVPREHTRAMNVPVSRDNLAIPGTRCSQAWMKDLECPYYRMILPEQSLLVFSGSGCLHQFTNIEENGVMPRALLVRVRDAWGADTRVSSHHAFNPRWWWKVHNQIFYFVMGKFYPDWSNEDISGDPTKSADVTEVQKDDKEDKQEEAPLPDV